MDLFSVFADVLWIIALAVMASASRGAAGRLGGDARIPALPVAGGRGWRFPRNAALAFNPALALVFGLALLAADRTAADADAALVLFGLRVAAAPLIALAHLRWLKAVMAILAGEGGLKP